MSEFIINATDENFASEVLESDIPVLVDFWAEWCAPCRMVAPFLDQIAQENQGKVKVVKCNVDDCARTAGEYEVASIPTFILFKQGAPVKRQTGALPLAQLKQFIEG
ncbi:MAG: thioredoxin [Brevinema sp.]